MDKPKHVEFKKIPRLSRMIQITEKIDGTNGLIYIPDDESYILAGSKNRWLTPEQDNHGFCKWVLEHTLELVTGLGPGYHYGEWWGQGIQRGYGLREKRFSLFNLTRWGDGKAPTCCHVVPLLYEGMFSTEMIEHTLAKLKESGSQASLGFMRPEGIVIYHTAGNLLFKKTFENDAGGKGDDR